MTPTIERYAASMRARNERRRKHGTLNRYRNGCRCGACCNRNAKACRDHSSLVRYLAARRAA